MIHSDLRPYVARRRHKSVVARHRERHKRRVQVDDRRQRVEGPLGQRPFRAGPGCRWRFARHARNKLHEQFGQLHVMHRIKHRQRPDVGRRVRGVVAPPRHHGVDRREKRRLQRDAPLQPRRHLRRVHLPRMGQVRPLLQVTRVLGHLPVDQPRMRRGHEVGRAARVHSRAKYQFPHRFAIGLEPDAVLHQFPRVPCRQRLEI